MFIFILFLGKVWSSDDYEENSLLVLLKVRLNFQISNIPLLTESTQENKHDNKNIKQITNNN